MSGKLSRLFQINHSSRKTMKTVASEKDRTLLLLVSFIQRYFPLSGTRTAALSCVILNWLVECCFTYTKTVGLLETGAQDGHLDFHTAPELWILNE